MTRSLPEPSLIRTSPGLFETALICFFSPLQLVVIPLPLNFRVSKLLGSIWVSRCYFLSRFYGHTLTTVVMNTTELEFIFKTRCDTKAVTDENMIDCVSLIQSWSYCDCAIFKQLQLPATDPKGARGFGRLPPPPCLCYVSKKIIKMPELKKMMINCWSKSHENAV